MKAEQITAGIKQALLKSGAINPKNIKAIEALLDNQVLNDIKAYGLQGNNVCVNCDKEKETHSICGGESLKKKNTSYLQYRL